jgi:uncharacterized protein
MNQEALETKKERLFHIIEGLDSLLIAFSGGVDSTYLLAVAHRILGDRAVAATARSPLFPRRETDRAETFARERGIQHVMFDMDEKKISGVLSNPPERCYFCKQAISERLLEIARDVGLKHVAHGANLDDQKDYRPGLKAAEEAGILSPLIEAGLSKNEIRRLSRDMGLPSWDLPSMACLASRIPYHEAITDAKLERVEKAEAYLLEHGFKQCRVRHHGTVARLELEGEDMARVLELAMREKIVGKFRELGFIHVSLDLEGYKTGSMNRALRKISIEEDVTG